MIKEIHIFDFDGTLVDSTHRYQTDETGDKIDLSHWIANECKAHLDKPITKACETFRKIRNDASKYALIATARIWCDKAEKVCKDADIVPNGLVSRRARNDNRGGAALKIAHVKRLLNLKQFKGVEVIHVYEDNLTYLKAIQSAFNGVGHYHPSKQGH